MVAEMLWIIKFQVWLQAPNLNLIMDDSELWAKRLKVNAQAFQAFEQLVHLWKNVTGYDLGITWFVLNTTAKVVLNMNMTLFDINMTVFVYICVVLSSSIFLPISTFNYRLQHIPHCWFVLTVATTQHLSTEMIQL